LKITKGNSEHLLADPGGLRFYAEVSGNRAGICSDASNKIIEINRTHHLFIFLSMESFLQKNPCIARKYPLSKIIFFSVILNWKDFR